MTKLDKDRYMLGYHYKIIALDNTWKYGVLYVKTLFEASTLVESFPFNRFKTVMLTTTEKRD